MIKVRKIRVNGAITVVNAIASWKGSAIGIDYEVSATAEVSDDLHVRPDDLLIREAASLALKAIGGEGAYVEVKSEIPIGWGLKSSSAVANATVLAIMSLYGEVSMKKALEISVRASRMSGVSITGALDDAAASMLGGFVITDNLKDEILMRAPLKERNVVILLPDREKAKLTRELDANMMKPLANVAESIFDLLPKRVWEAMTLNGLLYSSILGYDPSPALDAVKLGALGAGLSGTGPAIAAVCDKCGEIVRKWSSLGKVVVRRITNEAARFTT